MMKNIFLFSEFLFVWSQWLSWQTLVQSCHKLVQGLSAICHALPNDTWHLHDNHWSTQWKTFKFCPAGFHPGNNLSIWGQKWEENKFLLTDTRGLDCWWYLQLNLSLGKESSRLEIIQFFHSFLKTALMIFFSIKSDKFRLNGRKEHSTITNFLLLALSSRVLLQNFSFMLCNIFCTD